MISNIIQVLRRRPNTDGDIFRVKWLQTGCRGRMLLWQKFDWQTLKHAPLHHPVAGKANWLANYQPTVPGTLPLTLLHYCKSLFLKLSLFSYLYLYLYIAIKHINLSTLSCQEYKLCLTRIKKQLWYKTTKTFNFSHFLGLSLCCIFVAENQLSTHGASVRH